MRKYERNWFALQEQRWTKFEGILLFGHCSWLRLCKQRSFLDKIEIQIRNEPYRNCSTWLQNWLASKSSRYREYQKYSGELLHGTRCLWHTTRRRSSSWRQKFMSSQTLFYVLEEHANPLNVTKNGKDDSRGSKVLTNTVNWIASRWRTSGVRVCNFPRTYHTADTPRDPKKLMDSLKCREEDFQARIILMSMCNDIDWRNEECWKISSWVVMPYFEQQVHWDGDNWKVHEEDECFFSFYGVRIYHGNHTPHCFFC